MAHVVIEMVDDSGAETTIRQHSANPTVEPVQMLMLMQGAYLRTLRALGVAPEQQQPAHPEPEGGPAPDDVDEPTPAPADGPVAAEKGKR